MSDILHRSAFWLLVMFICGIVIGGYGVYKFNKWQMSEAVKLGGFIYKEEIYNVNKRP